MVDTFRSPFEGHALGERPNKAGQVGVRLSAGTLPSVTQVSTWISGLPGLLQAMGPVLGEKVPQQIGKTAQTSLGLLLRTGPEEFLLVGEEAGDRMPALRAAIAADVGAVTDLSHARSRIRISGDQARTMLNKLFPLDLREASFPIGDVAMTGTHHVPSTLHRVGVDSFDLYVFSTYAYDQLNTVIDAALEYGVAYEKASA